MQLPSPEAVELWFHYEEIAMHFNELLIQYRLQLMGGLGAISTLIIYLFTFKKGKNKRDLRYIRMISVWVIWVILLAAVALDIFYYQRLLDGALKVLLEFEKMHPEIAMSTTISETVGEGTELIKLIYSLLIAIFFGISVWFTFAFHKKR